jgi:hypothetical protein
MPSGASEDIVSAFKVTLTKRDIDLLVRHVPVHSAVSDLAAMSVTHCVSVAMGLDPSPCQMHNLTTSSKVAQTGLGTLITKDGRGAVVDPFTDMARTSIVTSLKELANLLCWIRDIREYQVVSGIKIRDGGIRGP